MAASAGGMNRFYLILGGLAVAGAAVLAALTLRKPAVSIPANAAVQVSDTSGFHGYYAGSDSAPLSVTARHTPPRDRIAIERVAIAPP